MSNLQLDHPYGYRRLLNRTGSEYLFPGFRSGTIDSRIEPGTLLYLCFPGDFTIGHTPGPH